MSKESEGVEGTADERKDRINPMVFFGSAIGIVAFALWTMFFTDSAGAVLADRLSAGGTHQVLVLEKPALARPNLRLQMRALTTRVVLWKASAPSASSTVRRARPFAFRHGAR